jgi:hypothetical protein
MYTPFKDVSFGKFVRKETHFNGLAHKLHRRIEWNAERFLSWGRSIGEKTETVVAALLASRQIEQQSYKACIGLLKLADKYSITRLEAACKRALSFTATPSLKSIQAILKSGSDKFSNESGTHNTSAPQHAFTRGAGYYGRKS